jgi:soluble lytic murein transglycosylase-like protein
MGSPAFAQSAPRVEWARSPSEQYLAYRHAYPPLKGLTIAVAGSNPNAYRGMSMELEGRLSGVVRAEQDGALLILDTERYGSLTLSMSLLPTWVQPGARLRVLAVVAGTEENEITVGTPDLIVVAVASASDIINAEYRAAQNARTLREQSTRRTVALQAAQKRLSLSNQVRTSLLSRGGSVTRTAKYVAVPSRGSAAQLLAGMSPETRAVFPQYRQFIQSWNKRLPAQDADDIAASVLLFSEQYDVDPRLVIALIIAESDFRPQTTSHKGAMGLGQLMPDEVKTLGLTNPYDPVQNVAGAVYLLRGRLDKYSGGASSQSLQMQHIVLALASYNAGMGAVKRYGGVPPYRETQNYVKKIERIYRQLCAGSAPAGGYGQ